MNDHKCAAKMSLQSVKGVISEHDCFADISTEETCTVLLGN